MDYSIPSIMFLGCIAFGLLYTAVATAFLGWERLKYCRRKNHLTASDPLPAVSVMKPLKGLDGDLLNNLRSFFQLDYPSFELVFGVEDFDDPAIAEVRRLQALHPSVKSRLVVNSQRIGENPKVNNLHNMYSFVNNDIVVISDSNVRVRPDYLTHLVRELESPGVGLVTSVIRGIGGEGWGAHFENLHLNSFIAGSVYVVSRIFRVPVTIGKSMCLRRSTLRRIGGFEALSQYLIEDGVIGRRVIGLGLEIRQSFAGVDNINAEWTITDFLSRHVRWSIMRRFLHIGNYAAEILSNPVALAVVYAMVMADMVSLYILIATCVFKMSLDCIASRCIQAPIPLAHAVLIPIKDLLIGGIWCVPFFRRTVVWRGNRFAIGKDTVVARIRSAQNEFGPEALLRTER